MYEDLMRTKGITHHEMIKAWTDAGGIALAADWMKVWYDDGVIVDSTKLMVPVRGARKRRGC